jgi:D-sedoheptulose 7-phosphate isomerase
MREFISEFSEKVQETLQHLPVEEIAKAINILQACYERDGRIYVFGNGGSLAIATHWVSDINKTIFSHHLSAHSHRFQAVRLPSTESEITAWANDVGYDMIFAGPLQNYIQDSDVVIAISSSGNSLNITKAVELARKNNVPVIGLSGFDGGRLNELADAKILVKTETGQYEVVESAHGTIMHLITKYFKDYFDHIIENRAQ